MATKKKLYGDKKQHNKSVWRLTKVWRNLKSSQSFFPRGNSFCKVLFPGEKNFAKLFSPGEKSPYYIMLPLSHYYNLRISGIQFEFVVDNQFLADMYEGHASLRSFRHTRALQRLIEDLARLVIASWMPRMCVLPLVAWRRRRYNTLTDGLANIVMDCGHDVKFFDADLFSHELPSGAILQWHSDGGARNLERAACACSLTLIRRINGEYTRTLVFAQAFCLAANTDSLQAEIAALQSAHHKVGGWMGR